MVDPDPPWVRHPFHLLAHPRAHLTFSCDAHPIPMSLLDSHVITDLETDK
jgi:hypothetical protein